MFSAGIEQQRGMEFAPTTFSSCEKRNPVEEPVSLIGFLSHSYNLLPIRAAYKGQQSN